MKIHDKLPSGFAYANELQAEEFAATGSIHGAGKIAQVIAQDPDGPDHSDDPDYAPDTDLAIRLRPPRFAEDIRSPLAIRTGPYVAAGMVSWYIAEYNNGWQAARRSADSKAWDSGMTSAAWDDGYLDQAAGRQKWHLTYCTDHDNCGEG